MHAAHRRIYSRIDGFTIEDALQILIRRITENPSRRWCEENSRLIHTDGVCADMLVSLNRAKRI